MGRPIGWHWVSVTLKYRVGKKLETLHGDVRWAMNNFDKVGDVAIPRKIEFRGSFIDSRGPMWTMGIELRNGVPECVYLELDGEGDNEVRSKHLKAIPVEEWVTQVVAACSQPVIDEPEPDPYGLGLGPDYRLDYGPTTPEKLKTVERMQRRRRDPRSDRALLEHVAEMYREHPGAPNQAIAAAFGVSERTAARWAKYASEAGLLPKVNQGQKRI
jgi:hypothetical protein